jgi:plasmid stabilization system protein ParE
MAFELLIHIPYEITPAAEADLREIARYTRKQWGEE